MAWRKPANLNEWFGIILRHKKKFFFPAVLVMIGFIWASQWWPREYTAEAKFKRRSETSMSPQAGGNPIGEEYGRIRALMQYNFKGRPAIEQLITDLSLTTGFPRTADGELTADGKILYNDLVNRLSRSISVSNQVASDQIDLVSVSYTSTDREMVPKVCNQIVENYIRTVRKQMDDTLLEQKKFFESEVNRYRRRVGELENARLQFGINHGGVNPDDPLVVFNKLNTLKTDRESLATEFEKNKAGYVSLKKWEEEQPEFVKNKKTTENPDLLAIKDKLKKLKEMLDIHVYEYRRTVEHPAVKDLVRRIAATEKEIINFEGGDKIEEEEVPNTEKLSAQKDLSILEGRLAADAKKLEETNAEIERSEIYYRNFFTTRQEFLRLTRELTESATQLAFWDDSLRRIQMALTLSVGEKGLRLSFEQRAPELAKPSSPTLAKIIGGAVVLGLAIGTLMIVLAELLDHSYRTVEQAIDEIKLPVLGAINEIVSPAAAMRRKIFGWGVFPAVTTLLILVLLGVFAMTYLSLEAPHKYELLKDDPVRFLQRTFNGGV